MGPFSSCASKGCARPREAPSCNGVHDASDGAMPSSDFLDKGGPGPSVSRLSILWQLHTRSGDYRAHRGGCNASYVNDSCRVPAFAQHKRHDANGSWNVQRGAMCWHWSSMYQSWLLVALSLASFLLSGKDRAWLVDTMHYVVMQSHLCLQVHFHRNHRGDHNCGKFTHLLKNQQLPLKE